MSTLITVDNFVRVEYFSRNPRDFNFVTIFFDNGVQILFDRKTGILSSNEMGYANELNSKDRDVMNSMIDSFVHLKQNDMIYENPAISYLPTPTPAFKRTQSSPFGGGNKSKTFKKKRSIGKSPKRYSPRRSGLNTLPVHKFTAEMNREVKRLQIDKSKRGRFIWETIEEDIHNIKNMKDLKSWVKRGSDLYRKLADV